MRLNNYLNEFNRYYGQETRSKNITKEETIDLLNKHCTYDLEVLRIYRGSDTDSPTVLIEPAKYTRISANTENYYTILLDNLPEWKQYPKRSKSIICSTNVGYARDFGNVYRVFPYDNAKIGICPEDDLWSSFSRYLGYSSLADFNYWLEEFAAFIHMNKYMNNYNELLKLFDKIDESKEEIIIKYKEENTFNLPRLFVTYLESPISFLDNIKEIFNPDNNDFELKKPEHFDNPANREVWTDSPSILISEDVLRDYI